jgi:hypothetical protein
MITGVRVAERNDQVAGTKGSDVRTNGECMGTRYGVIYIGSEGNEGWPSECRSQSSGTGLGNGCAKPSEFRSQSSGTGLGERDLTIRAEVDIQLFGEKLEVYEPFGFVCRVIDKA